MSIRVASRAARPASPAISRPVPTSGSRGLCEKPKSQVRRVPAPPLPSRHRRSRRWHLSGRDERRPRFRHGRLPDAAGRDLLLPGRRFRQDTLAGRCRGHPGNMPPHEPAAALERSRSGNGGHVWLFFEEAIPAALARRLGSHILTETMERRPDIGLDSYDRFFPNQDTLPQGGFGNLIALPLQKRPRERGNSVFLDEQCSPYPDQWAFLSTVPKIDSIDGRGDRSRCRREGARGWRAACPGGRGRCRSRGPRRPRAAARSRRSPGRCRRAWN